ncbi:C21orf62: Chromosome 21 orf 62 [Crotalus adamanteus]|uniref:C21orf62: Chromosome 21 orf 62 n=1 Tax=Crotalus adamanteus TaxID=8729 RepID=A0AAW1BJZ6_CROAD
MAFSAHRNNLFLIGLLSFCVDSFMCSEKNNTLIFTKENTIRKCMCPPDTINDCDYSLANLICNCKTVLPYTVDKTYYDNLVIWFTETDILRILFNVTSVHNLKLSLCGTIPLTTKYLTIWGLQKLQIRSENNSQLKQQSLTISTSCDNGAQGKLKMSYKDKNMITHVAVLDTSLFNGSGPLKSYSVENISNISDQFPHLDNFFTPSNKSCIITFIY